MLQVFRHFQADEPAAYYRGCLDALLLHHGADAVGIRHGPKGLYPRRIDARDGRAYGRGPRSQHKGIVGFLIGFAGLQPLDYNLILGPVNGGGFIIYAHIHVEFIVHGLGGLEKQRASGLNYASNMIGQTTIGIRNIRASLQQYDFRFLVQPSKPGRAAGAARNASDNDNLTHFTFPLLLFCSAL
ncbi:hypothetical protein SDC9_176836 [bioreactor metagenome]|uniref:Uncharacterized protein n=1 Tax=bioreactor metagenome TaxID=1076179 RepID=A0A645H0I5_9ZZZZ